MSDDWEYDEADCPKCQNQLATRTCYSCGGDGYVEEEDDDWGGEERCDNCNGMGHETWCRECGWDINFKCFLSPEYEQKWKESEAAQQAS